MHIRNVTIGLRLAQRWPTRRRWTCSMCLPATTERPRSSKNRNWIGQDIRRHAPMVPQEHRSPGG